jgi:hypothetical protein
MTTFRNEERARAIAEALKEGLNTNGMHRTISPPSTRTVAESHGVEQEPVASDRVPSGSTGAVQYVGSVRDALESTAAKKRDEPPVTPQSDTDHWYEWEMAWQERTKNAKGWGWGR